MRRFERPSGEKPLISSARQATRTTLIRSAELLYKDGAVSSATCLRCPDIPCIYTWEKNDKNPLDICVFDAIVISDINVPKILDTCAGCGLCILRCPIGAITLSPESTIAEVQPPNISKQSQEASAEEQKDFFDKLTLTWKISKRERKQMSDKMINATLTLGHDKFYPMISNIFSEIGFPNLRNNPGDTNNRIDLVLTHHQDSLPIEIKSPTESPQVNVKSILQALENKIVMDERSLHSTLPDSSSLVVALEYPPQRSDVSELIDDIFKTYNIRIGLISIPKLVNLLFQTRLDGITHKHEILSKLRGPL